MPPPTAAVTAEDIAVSPAWLPLDAGGAEAVRLVRLDESAYRAASFLDRRILTTNPTTATVASTTVTAAAATLAPRAHYIFHIGHVGSTLVSRLVGEFEGLFSVREPAMLREAAALQVAQPEPHAADAHADEAHATEPEPAESHTAGPRAAGTRPPGALPAEAPRAGTRGAANLRNTLGLLSRTWRPGQRAVVKATSFVGEIAESILETDRGAAAIVMFTPAPAYLRCILGGPNSRVESRALAPTRWARLRRRLAEATLGMNPGSEGQWIAMGWLCEMACLQHAAQRFASRVLWIDFDEFLAAPRAGLQAILAALGATTGPDDISRILGGSLMHRYSKAPEHAYDAALRREVLACAEREHPQEIRRGMAWLEALGARHHTVAAALNRR